MVGMYQHTWTCSLQSHTPPRMTPCPPPSPPRTGSGLLTTADSATAGCSARAFSTSAGPMRYLQDHNGSLPEQIPGLRWHRPSGLTFGETHLPPTEGKVSQELRPVQTLCKRTEMWIPEVRQRFLWHKNSLLPTFAEILHPVPKLCNVSFHFPS